MPEKNTIITFPAGLPGLPAELTRFELIAVMEDSPFFFLQSLQNENTGFILVNPFAFFPGYEFDLPEEDARALDIKAPEEAVVFCIVNASGGLANATVNLLAPVVVNAATGTARQVVLTDARWGIRHPLPVARRAEQEPAAAMEKVGERGSGRPPGAPFLLETERKNGRNEKPEPSEKGKTADSGGKGEPACSS